MSHQTVISVGGLLLLLTGLGAYVYSISQPSSESSRVEVPELISNLSPDRSTRFATTTQLPVAGSAPTADTYHTITLTEIRQGCFRQDCIPSVDTPKFVSADNLSVSLAPSSLGIFLSYKNEQRFYPFPMLETRELVNDIVAGDPLLISYCPLCGTGIVFSRDVAGAVLEFGVSGMLWNSNLLMYDRASELVNRNLWSQVLGEAVVGNRAGTALTIIPSDIMTFAQFQAVAPQGLVLDTGSTADPYQGQYFAVAAQFAPNFDVATSPVAPDTYVYGVLVDGAPLAISANVLADREAEVFFNNQYVTITQSVDGEVTVLVAGAAVPDREGFWFSFKAAYPAAQLWDDATISTL